MTDDATTRWFIVCDCAGHPEELVGVVDVNAAGEARVHDGGSWPSLRGANRLMLSTPVAERADVLRKLKTREIALPATVTFSHSPCGKAARLTEPHLRELMAAVASAVEGQRVSLALLCAVNGRLPRGATR